MALVSDGEFDLIERLFKGAGGSRKAFTRLGIGDDASIHQLEPGMELVISTDSSVQGVHWPDDFPLDQAADKAVCSALSDLAAMGAAPVCVWLNVMAKDAHAVTSMAAGLSRALKRYDVELVGGDTSRAAVNALSVTVAGQLPEGSAMRRGAALCDDNIWLAGRVGFHALGLQCWINHQKEKDFSHLFGVVTPQLEAGLQLRDMGVACCIDVSDGLLQDAGHIATASGIGMDIEISSLPDWAELSQAVGAESALALAAHGGEDYALLFTAPAFMQFPDTVAVRIGSCRTGEGVNLLMHGEKADVQQTGFDHFG